ncbi:hypothetical protein TL16_g07147 [Triparma laevis f. inornata]|uniref:Mannosyltransferase n=1 Tax=Triparma laevis f. inornata TaxID=1714386 RepID=A0A9W7AX37_9STRA|nr:hypothetical protein TL16_g07147 [Triparma laevis f. inornata]
MLSLILAYRASTLSSNLLTDCDEVYNYYEPLHFTLYGYGLQTWEYAEEYALRTYAFLMPAAAVVKTTTAILTPLINLNLLPPHLLSKPSLFNVLRLFLSWSCGYSEYRFILSIYNHLSPQVSLLTFLFLTPSAGMFHAAPAFLPSSVALTLTMLSTSLHIDGEYIEAIFFGMLSVVGLGWPFVAVLYIPLGLHSLHASYTNPHASTLSHRLLASTLTLFIAIFLLTSLSFIVFLVDNVYYEKATIPSLNIFLYNAVGSTPGEEETGKSTGDELYGVEPFSYYLKNLALNFNLIAVLSLLYPFTKAIKYLTQTKKPSKAPPPRFNYYRSARFLFPIYHLIAFSAAVSLNDATTFLKQTLKLPPQITKLLLLSTLAATTLLSRSRINALSSHYSAPLKLYTKLHSQILSNSIPNQSVCVTGEWHRFVSHFFLPLNSRLQFVESGFTGQLPQHFTSGGSAVKAPQKFNAVNGEENERYVDISSCDYFVDLTLPSSSTPKLLQTDSREGAWTMVEHEIYLDAERTAGLSRVIQIPGVVDGGVYEKYAFYEFH